MFNYIGIGTSARLNLLIIPMRVRNLIIKLPKEKIEAWNFVWAYPIVLA